MAEWKKKKSRNDYQVRSGHGRLLLHWRGHSDMSNRQILSSLWPGFWLHRISLELVKFRETVAYEHNYSRLFGLRPFIALVWTDHICAYKDFVCNCRLFRDRIYWCRKELFHGWVLAAYLVYLGSFYPRAQATSHTSIFFLDRKSLQTRRRKYSCYVWVFLWVYSYI